MPRIRPLALLVSMGLLLAACSGGESPSPSVASQAASGSADASASEAPPEPSGEPIRIGVIDMISGANAQIGTDTFQGATIAVDQINAAGGVLGRPLELVQEDEAPDSAAAVNALRSLNSDGVQFVMGFTSSADALAAIPIAEQIDSIIVGSHPATTALTGPDVSPNFFRVSANDEMATTAISMFANENFPEITKWNVFGFDYVTGHDQWDSFVTNLTELNGDFTKGAEVFFPFDAVGSLQPYITSMLNALPADSAENEGLYMATFGAGTFNLIQQGAQYDIMDQFAVVAVVAGGGFLHQAQQLGADTPEMYSQYDYYYEAYDTPENQAYVEAYQEAFDTVPGSWATQGYMSVLAYAAAIEKAGNTEFEDVRTALEGITFAAPQGEVEIRAEDHQATVNVVMRHFVPDPDSEEGFEVADFEVFESADILE
ncbi:MAG TPA: ABC transporter substrate-binding protein [Candidatus Limnocylindria bacterium]|nr:ABC transporter substrate-binding protein [Candidatus Limnocylindria bacterium]